jgi:hypothetical protein
MQLARSFAERTDCPVMRYLADAQFLGLAGLWRKLCAGAMPARCTKQVRCAAVETGGARRGRADGTWRVRGTHGGARATHPERASARPRPAPGGRSPKTRARGVDARPSAAVHAPRPLRSARAQWFFETFCAIDAPAFAARGLAALGIDDDIVGCLDGVVKPYDVLALNDRDR